MLSVPAKRLLRLRPQGARLGESSIFRAMATATHNQTPSHNDPPPKKYSITGKERRETSLVSQDKPVGALQYVLYECPSQTFRLPFLVQHQLTHAPPQL